jgi:hydrogenase-4 component B
MNSIHALCLAAIGMLTGILSAWSAPRWWLGSTVFGCLATLISSIFLLSGGPDWEYLSAVKLGGECIHLRLDGLSAFFLILLSVIGATGAVYGREYWPAKQHPISARWGRLGWSGLVLSMGLILLVSNGLHFLIAWELFAVIGYFLIVLDGQRREVRTAGWLYLAASHAGTLCLFAFFTLIAVITGSWDLGPMQSYPELAPLFWLAFIGFGIKAGLIPLHIWLPSAHANAPSHVSAMLSGVAIKMGIYGLIRFSGWMPMPAGADWLIAGMGTLSAVLGVALALGQHDLKRLLAYHSVENIGIILIGLGFALIAAHQGHPVWGQLALAGCLLHVWNHGLFKSLLFLGAGSVIHTMGTREMSRMGGLWKTMPWTTAFFGIGAAAISGLPPLNGFVSEWLIFLGLFDATISHGSVAWMAIPSAVFLGITGALALACFAKVCGIVFLGAPRSPIPRHAHECGVSMRFSMGLLAGLCIAIGLFPFIFWPALSRAIGVWEPSWATDRSPAPLFTLGRVHLILAAIAFIAVVGLWKHAVFNTLRRALTWDCGFARPSARMQYTAGSFAALLNEWTAFVLRPIQESDRPTVLHPKRAHWKQHTPDAVLKFILEPLAYCVLLLSRSVRNLQQGRVQSYLLYLLFGLLLLTGIVLATQPD